MRELGAGLEASQASRVPFPATWRVFGQEGCPLPLLHSLLVVASPCLRGDGGFIIWWDLCIVKAFFEKKEKFAIHASILRTLNFFKESISFYSVSHFSNEKVPLAPFFIYP